MISTYAIELVEKTFNHHRDALDEQRGINNETRCIVASILTLASAAMEIYAHQRWPHKDRPVLKEEKSENAGVSPVVDLYD